MSSGTLIDQIWDARVVSQRSDGSDLLYVDLHLIHEASSPQAFDGLREAGRRVRRPDLTLAVEDHNVPTDTLQLRDELGRAQLEALRANCAEHGIEHLRHGAARQGIVHVVAPELGLVQPGMTVVCGDSHTSTHGALGAIAFGVGTSDVEHVLATQTLSLRRPRTMAVDFAGPIPPGITAKDVALALIARIGANGAHGHVIEYRGEAVTGLSMEGRLTLCNLSIEAGARAGLVAPDAVTAQYLRGRPCAPADAEWDAAAQHWGGLGSAPDAEFDRVVTMDLGGLTSFVTWGTHPGQAVPLDGRVPAPEDLADPVARSAAARALDYMKLTPGTAMRDIAVDVVFLGSCTNGRIEDLRAAADVLRGRKVADRVHMLVVPGSMQVRRAAEAEGLHEVFSAAGAEWRLSGCSMCMGMNTDRLLHGERVASTSNRNYEGRQGTGARTHLVSPQVAAATAVAGRLAAPTDLSS
jgi:3-isopropylmalate/(R)-2-methylmalate dehydratase large subunit